MTCEKCGNPSETGLKDGICPDCALADTGPVPRIVATNAEVLAHQAKLDKKAALAPRPPVEMTAEGVHLKSLDDLARFSQMIVDSGLAPKGMERPQAVAVAVQCGMELGFSPMRALSAVYVVNGRPGLYGQAALGKIRSSGLAESLETGVRGDGDQRVGYCKSRRRGASEAVERTFSVQDAKRMGLWGKAGPWTSDPDSMLMWRAVARSAKQDWSDVLMGLELAEVIRDIEPVRQAPALPSGPDPLMGE